MSQQVTVRAMLDTAGERLKGRFTDEPLVEASIRQYLGRTYIELGDYAQAEFHLKRAGDLRRRALGDKDPLTLDSMSQLGRLYFLQGRYREAEPVLARALEFRRRVLGPDHVATLETGVWLGLTYVSSFKTASLEQADTLLTTAYTSGRDRLGDKHPLTLEATYGLSFLRGAIQGRYQEAADLCLAGEQAARETLGSGHRLTVDFMILAAMFDVWNGQFTEALDRAQRSLDLTQRVLGEEHPSTVCAMGMLGHVYAAKHEPEPAEPLLRRAVELGRSVLRPDHSWVVLFTTSLGYVRLLQGDYAGAEPLFKEALTNGRRFLPDNHPLVANAMPGLSMLYAMQERPDEFQAWLSTERERISRTYGDEHPAMAFFLNGLAWLQATYPSPVIRDGNEAVRNATKACQLGGGNEAAFLDTLAAAYAETGDFEAAVREETRAIDTPTRLGDIPYPQEALNHARELFKKNRVVRESFLTMGARARIATGKYAPVEQELTAALATARRYLGDTHPETRGCILALIELYEAWGKPGKAEEWQAQLAQLPPEDPAPPP
jgi:tetratricopeptide (TPR) repeat protein